MMQARDEPFEELSRAAETTLTLMEGSRSVRARPGEVVTFGRSPRRTIPLAASQDDRQLHRLCGAFRFAMLRWELHNEGDSLPLEVEIVGGLRATVQPGSLPLALPFGSLGSVRVRTTRTYEIAFEVAPLLGGSEWLPIHDAADDSTTEGLRELLGLTEQELETLIALCEPRLRDPEVPTWTVPDYPALCERLGITKRAAEDRIDALAARFANHVPDLLASSKRRSVYRRQRIVEFALRTRCVDQRDLRQLPRQ